MILAVSGRTDSYTQFLTVLLLFLFVLFVTYAVTKWTAGYQKSQGANANVEVLETARLAGSKYVQIVRVGRRYLAVAVCKDTVTMLAEIAEQDLVLPDGSKRGAGGFRDILEKIQGKNFPEKEDGRDE